MFGLAWVCFTYAIFSIGFKSLYPDPDTINSIFRISRLIILPINFLLICWIIIKVKHPLIAYFIIGNLFFFVGSVLSVYRSEEHTSELQSLMRISYAVFCLKKKKIDNI